MSERKRELGLEVGTSSVEMFVSSIKLPDLREVAEGSQEQEQHIKTELRVGEELYPCELIFQRLKKRGSEEYQTMRLSLTLTDPSTREPVATFKGLLSRENMKTSSYGDDGFDPLRSNSLVDNWLIYTKRVEKPFQGKGIGLAGFEIFEELCRRIGQEYPDLAADCIRVSTGFTSVVRLLISREWVETHNLRTDGLSSHGRGLGYIPFPENRHFVQTLLDAGIESVDELEAKKGRTIELRKNLATVHA